VSLCVRAARPSVAKNDIAPSTGRARISYRRRAAELFEAHTDRYDDPYALHRPTAALPVDPTRQREARPQPALSSNE